MKKADVFTSAFFIVPKIQKEPLFDTLLFFAIDRGAYLLTKHCCQLKQNNGCIYGNFALAIFSEKALL